MSELRFDDRVAVVTGAGGKPGLGRSHALLLAERGAKVVVNDLGVGPDGAGTIPADAERTAAEIRDAGGEAVADFHSVADEQSARAIVQTALDTWGRIDILVNNAGVGVVAGFDEVTTDDLEIVVNVHLKGQLWMCRAAWPHMLRAGYGRIVNTTSGGMYGTPGLVVYGAAKFGIYGLTRGLAVEGVGHDIKVNAMSPGAYTNSLDPFFELESAEAREAFISAIPAELVSPVVAYLAHESCEVSGGLFDVGGGAVSSTFLVASAGIHKPGLTIEDVGKNLGDILDRSQERLLTDLRDPLGTINEASQMLIRKPYGTAYPLIARTAQHANDIDRSHHP